VANSSFGQPLLIIAAAFCFLNCKWPAGATALLRKRDDGDTIRELYLLTPNRIQSRI
jgi:hypothetical protein